MKKLFTLVTLLSLSTLAYSQISPSTPTDNLLEHVESKNIGPSVFGGRVVDLAVNPELPSEFYVAYASGGLWHTKNNGTTFTPIFDNEEKMTIGDIAIHWETRTIYVGTGEVNSSRSSYAGNGVYKSTDNGETWTYLGLPESHHIGRILIHKDNPNIVNVAVLGHLYSPNKERGMYTTTDGGATWKQTLFVNENAGAVDLVAHPENENVLYAVMWERTRRAWNFTEAGAGSGIYKSTDSGSSWVKISNPESNFPQGEGTGRIGLDIVVAEGTTYIYAILDNYNRRPKEDKKKSTKLTKDDFASMTKASFASLSEEKLQAYFDDNGIKDYTVKAVKKMVADDEIQPIALKEYVEDANRLLFDTPVIGAEVYVTTDEGSTWAKTHTDYIDGLYNSYGYYFGQIRVNPTNKDQLYIMGVPILRSDDGGAHWKNVNGDNVHVDHHALWINPAQPDHIINGNDGGVNISYDAGDSWIKCTSPPVGQFYYINIDKADNYKVYGGTQDNGVWVGSNNYNESVRWQMTGKYPYNTIMGGDGMQVQIDSRDNKTVYTGFQFGNYFRINTATQKRAYITPKHKLGERPYRWNWQSPILLSSHNQDIVYFGAQKLLRSMDQGDTFKEISEDLTYGGKVGDVAFGTLTTISESPFKFGLIYVGTDDGRVHMTKDGGNSWQDISKGLPDSLWISRVVASTHTEGVVYVSVNGYRNDVFTPYVYRSEDYGTTWTSIASTLPEGPINVIKEDPSNKEILYVGSDHGVFVSMDMGVSFMKLGGSFPNVPVHDLVVRDGTHEVIIGTHGRSIYKVDLAPVINGAKESGGLFFSSAAEVRHSSRWGSQRRMYDEPYIPDHSLAIFSRNAGAGTLELKAGKKTIYTEDVTLQKGMTYVDYHLQVAEKNIKKMVNAVTKTGDKKPTIEKADDGKYYLIPGEYTLTLSTQNSQYSKPLQIK